MCGIISIKGKNIVKRTVEGLKKLEYRGYDSCGIAYKFKGKIHIKKTKGYVSVLDTLIDNEIGNISIGHTRWATHGEPNETNSHPHSSMNEKVVCVHNGIIENYKDIKENILQGFTFRSETDTEVIPNLVQYYFEKCHSVLDAFAKTCEVLKGSFAIALICDYDNNIYFARKSSPLILALDGEEKVIVSDINGLKNTDKVFYMPDCSYGYLGNTFHVFDKNNNVIDIKYKNYNSQGQVDLGGFANFMIKEIHEIPNAIKSTYEYINTTTITLPKNISHILMVSCGTSYHASLVAKKNFEKYLNIPVDCEIASEFLCGSYLPKKDTLAIFISQSGETADTLQSMKLAQSLGMFTLAITNVENSSITQIADEVILMKAGVEICVASTKAYVTQIFVLLMLCNCILNFRDNQSKICQCKSSKCCKRKHEKSDCRPCCKTDCLIKDFLCEKIIVADMKNYLPYTYADLEEIFDYDIYKIEKSIKPIAKDICKENTMHIIGKDYDYITAMEGSLKIKETCYKFVDAYPCGELKHGTLSLIENGSVVLSIITNSSLSQKCVNSIHEVASRGGKVICITTLENLDTKGIFRMINFQPVAEIFLPIVSVIPFHLLAYHISISLGINPDKPRNLAKSVTVE